MIIFGSLPTIRTVLYSTAKTLKAKPRTAGSRTISKPSRLDRKDFDWLELSDGQGKRARSYGPTTFVVRAAEQDHRYRRKESPDQKQTWSSRSNSEGQAWPAASDEILVTTELRMNTEDNDERNSARSGASERLERQTGSVS